MFPYMGIRHVGAPRVWNLCKAHAISTLLVSVLRMFWSLKWIFPKRNSVRRWKKNIPVLSEYAKNLEGHVMERYVQKITGRSGYNTASLPSEQFDSENLPPIESTDLYRYLVLETSYYTKEQFRVFNGPHLVLCEILMWSLVSWSNFYTREVITGSASAP